MSQAPTARARSAVFLDRDGTLNVSRHRLDHPDELELLPGAAAAVGRLNTAGLLAVLVSNQPRVARGECSEDGLAAIHARLAELLAREDARLDALYYCPHASSRDGDAGCSCRKPATGMIERACGDLEIARATSWVIGDRTSDLQLARNARLRAVLVRTGRAGTDREYPVTPDYEFFDVREACDFIVDGFGPALTTAAEHVADIAPGDTILVGGLGRSGKSTWASVFREALAQRGTQAVCVPLDAWLRSADQREPGILGRFDIPTIEALAHHLRKRPRPPIDLELAGYDRRTRRRVPAEHSLRIEPDDVAIVEGVPALAIAPLLAGARRAFYVECQEPERRARFEREYRWRGEDTATIATLYAQRELDEHTFIRATARAASHVLTGRRD